jgi:predicted Zn-dependent protease
MKQLRKLPWLILGAVLFVSFSLLSPMLKVGFSANRAIAASPDISGREEILIQADKYYVEGDRAKAEELYRQVKAPFASHSGTMFPTPINTPRMLSTEAQTLWESAERAWEINGNVETLQQFVGQYPAYVPGQLLLAEALQKSDREEEALEALEQAATLLPNSVEIVKAQVAALEEEKDYLEASIAARQFATVNPNSPVAQDLMEVAENNFDKFQGNIKDDMVGKGLLGSAVKVGGCLLFGGCDPVTTAIGEGLQMGRLILQGESGLGKELAQAYKKQLPLVRDKQVVRYVREIGDSLAELMGRDEFKYEFYVVEDDSLNAFALPGGKVFIHTGTILNTNSTAELAGVIAHEIAHAVLSHGFKKVLSNYLYNNAGEIVGDVLKTDIPVGDILATLVSLSYSRSKERQADLVGTRVLATAGYAADGLRNFFVTLDEENGRSPLPFLSTHPVSRQRTRYLEELIELNGYNRYAFEGVEKHLEIQQRLKS